MYPRHITTLTLLAAPLVLVGTLATGTSALAQAGCGAAMADFQSALKAGTAEALTNYLGQHAPCFEAPARARLEALGAMPADTAATATQDPNGGGNATEGDPIPRGGSFLDNFWGGDEPKSRPSPLGDYDYKKRKDGGTRVNPPAAFLDKVPGANGLIAGFDLGPDGRVDILDEMATVIGRLPIDPPVPGSALSIAADGMMLIVGPDKKTLWSAPRGVVMEQGGANPDTFGDTLRAKLGGGNTVRQPVAAGQDQVADAPPAPGPAAPATLGELFLTGTLTTMWRQAEGECLSANRAATILNGAAHMATCAPQIGGDQVWQVFALSAEDTIARIVSSGGGEPLCLTANLGSGDATHRGGVYVDACVEDEMQIWKLEPAPEAQPFFRVSVPALGAEICLEGNSVASNARLGGASFLDTCQNVSGQFWIINEVLQ